MRPYRDIPLARDATNRFLPWTVGLMVFVATLALAASLILTDVGGTWRAGLAGSLTVQVMPLAGDGEAAAIDKRTEDAVRLLRETPGVESARALPREQTVKLLEPWLGPRAGTADLPMPRLIDVRLAERPRLDTAALAATLEQEMPGAVLDDHGLWLDRLVAFAFGLEAVAWIVMALIALASITTVIFTTRTGLAVHREVIELLHLIGAQDAYIAAEFQRQAFRLGMRGAVGGFALAIGVLAVIGHLSQRIDASLLPDLSFSTAQWFVLVCLPLSAVLLSTVTARITVMRSIGRRP